MKKIFEDIKGRIAPPLILWVLGVPGSICFILWLIFWRGK